MKYILPGIITITFIVMLSNCTGNSKESDKAVYSEADLSMGFNLVETNCFACHNLNPDMTTRVAPPMAMVKTHYIEKNTTQEQFINDLTHFMKNPNEKDTKMPGAIKKYGIMPKMMFSDEQLRAIAVYIYQTDIEKPEWFAEHYEEEKQKYQQKLNSANPTHVEQGLKYAMATKAVLGKNLLNAINTKGTEGALAFCNEKAIPLTDSMQNQLSISIKRVSDKNRNPDNAANLDELEYIMKSKHLLEDGEEIKPAIQEKGEKIVGYYPIMTTQMCLQCHGLPEKDIQAGTLSKLSSLYPEDKATGYGENELRGIWVVEMKK
ncbi:MAG: DUF3365 domain-containing protein [Bacteroidetes bacterium]|nr:DUF3365 domain-containing protein [Bacteroidota bacterium]